MRRSPILVAPYFSKSFEIPVAPTPHRELLAILVARDRYMISKLFEIPVAPTPHRELLAILVARDRYMLVSHLKFQ